jgi:hypothetical protein
LGLVGQGVEMKRSEPFDEVLVRRSSPLGVEEELRSYPDEDPDADERYNQHVA